jgi:hypothetical protein
LGLLRDLNLFFKKDLREKVTFNRPLCTTRGGLAPQILVGFLLKKIQMAPKKKICCKNEIADLKKGHDAEGPPIALGAPNLEEPRGIFPTSLYGQAAPVYNNKNNVSDVMMNLL